VKSEAATVASLLDDASARIAATLGLEKREARLEARVLAAHAWQVDHAWLIAHDTDRPSAAQFSTFDTLLTRRLTGEPVAYLTGTREFYGRPFLVTPDVLIPRPETELLVEAALECLPRDRPTRILDLGSGSGCIAITLALERTLAVVTAVDRSPAALAVALRNAALLNTEVEFLTSDWYDAINDRRFDLIVSNPPYVRAGDPHLTRGDVRFEPAAALASGHDGLDDLRSLIHTAGRHLKPGGQMLVEHGYDQGPACLALLDAAGFANHFQARDLAGHPRVSGGTWPGTR
jgi:release factor glutamine methyltransferase